MLASSQVLPTLLRLRAEEEPERVFLQHVDGTSWTYAELERNVLSWARGLASCGVEAGDRVVVMLPNSLELVAVWMAVARLGAIEVPPNTAYRGRFLEHVLVNAGARLGVVAPEFLPLFLELGDRVPALERLIVLGDVPERPGVVRAASILGRNSEAPLGLIAPEESDISMILYTSGTTGASKGVLIPWGQVHATAEALPPIEGRDEHDVFYSPYPLFHMSGKLAVCAAALLRGRIVIRAQFSTGEFWSDIDRFGCTTTLLIGGVPVFLAKLPERPDDAEHPLRNVVLAPPPEDAEAFCLRFGLRACFPFNMTELSVPLSTGWDQELVFRGSVGGPRPGYQVRIVDDLDRQLPPGEIGEIVVRADEPWRLMAGYWAMEDKTVEAWRNLWFHTGDVGRADPDGAFFFLDRKKDAIRRRGENISSMELEAEINEFEPVAESAVVGVPSEVGEEDVKAFVVPKPGVRFEAPDLIAFLEGRIPAFMLPRYVAVVDSLPKTPTEKVRKTELRERETDARTWERPSARR